MNDKIIEEIKNVGEQVWASENHKKKSLIKKLLKKYATAYYEGQALITDANFDKLLNVLTIIDSEDKLLHTPGWGYKVKNGVRHKFQRVGTLPYYYDYNEFKKNFKHDEKVIITPKFDGINFVAYFKNSNFKVCATRGNGLVGKNISWAFKEEITFPNNLKHESFGLNGEVIYLNFKKDYKDKEKVKHRDIVATYLNKNKKKISTNFVFVPFGILQTNKINNYILELEIINELSTFKLPYKVLEEVATIKQLKEIYDHYKSTFEIDGLVITNKDKSKQVAFKFE